MLSVSGRRGDRVASRHQCHCEYQSLVKLGVGWEDCGKGDRQVDLATDSLAGGRREESGTNATCSVDGRVASGRTPNQNRAC